MKRRNKSEEGVVETKKQDSEQQKNNEWDGKKAELRKKIKKK